MIVLFNFLFKFLLLVSEYNDMFFYFLIDGSQIFLLDDENLELIDSGSDVKIVEKGFYICLMI